jgi:hypothetical protein
MAGNRFERSAYLIAMWLLVVGCTAHVSGDLRIDGAPIASGMCETGERRGFIGVQLRDTAGRSIEVRLAPWHWSWYYPVTEEGTAMVHLLQQGETAGQPLGPCGPILIKTSAAHAVYRYVSGSATLSCRSADHIVVGTVQFENCH